MNNNNCIIIPHLSLNDFFIILGIIYYYKSIFNKIYIVAKNTNKDTIENIFLKENRIIPLFINYEKDILDDEHKIYDLYKNCEIIKIGMNNPNWYQYVSNINVGVHPYNYFKTFYEQLNINYELKFKYEYINRNYVKEKLLFNEISKNYKDYIFVFNVNKDNLKSENKKNKIFSPNINLCNNITENILDYSLILEKSIEIHCTFDYFFFLSMYLNLENVKKFIYTNIINFKDYHPNSKNWTLIYTNKN